MTTETRSRLAGVAVGVALAVAATALTVASLGARGDRGVQTPAATYTPKPAKLSVVEDIARSTRDVPRPIRRSQPATVRVRLETVEVSGRLADGVTYDYWTFGGTVPGPFIRVRKGDTVEITVDNVAGNIHMHSVDLHAVLGPGGGMAFTDSRPGQANGFRFKAMRPGIYVYHCASEHIPSHIANGMYGLILVEPERGLPRVDREFYAMQGDFYTRGPSGQKGHQEFDMSRLTAETPTYVVFNGRVGALTGEGALRARAGERVRIYFGNGGPNVTSSLHLIGGIFDRLYPEGDLVSKPHRNVQTTVVPPGGAAMMEFEALVPGTFLLVDHAISRAVDKGALGELVVTGRERPDLFRKK